MRILGSILILGASLWFGISLALKEKYRLEELEELERGLLYLQGQIQYLSAPLAEALQNVGWRTDGQVGRYVHHLRIKKQVPESPRCLFYCLQLVR